MAVCCCSIAAQASVLSLDGEWRLDYFPQPDMGAIRTLEIPAHGTVRATVPGCCELELVKAGLLPEPEVGLNAAKFRAYEGHQWLYSRTFRAARPTGTDRAFLVFDGIDTLADVFLNGEKVGEASNMLVPHRFDVTRFLKDGENEVSVLIRSALLEVRGQTLGQLGRTHPCGGGDDERIRKAAHMGGWDIFPRLYVSGLWRSVRLETDAGEAIDQPAWIVTDLDPEDRAATLTVQCRVRAPFARLDGWPQISDAVVDYYGGKKRAYDAIRNAQHDQLVMVRDDHKVVPVNDTLKPVKGKVRIADRESGEVLMEKSYSVPENAAVEIGSVGWSGRGILDIVYEQGGARRTNWFLYGEPPFDFNKVREWMLGK